MARACLTKSSSRIVPFNRQSVERMGLSHAIDKLSSERAAFGEWCSTLLKLPSTIK